MRECLVLVVAGVLAVACGTADSPGVVGPGVSPMASQAPIRTAASSFVFLPACPDAARPQFELDFAGLPPLVPERSLMRCLKMAATSGSAYDAGSDHVVELTDGQEVTLYERRGQMPTKPTVPSVHSGSRDIGGASWQWAELTNGSTVLTGTISDTYVELSSRGSASDVDELAKVAATLRPISLWPRPPAYGLCQALAWPGMTTVAAAFDSTAAAMAKWEETPDYPGGPHVASSDWRKAPPSEVVTLCYLDGAFGPARQPPPPPGMTFTPLPNYDRIVVQVGIDRRPIARTIGWRDKITIRDPGR